MRQNQYSVKLNNGVEMPVIGLGVWQAEDGQEVENAVRWAFDAGYRHIDTAKIYGNEAGVGKAVKRAGISRDKIFITTKLYFTDEGHDPALSAFSGSLNRLGMEYVDLYLIHWPFADREKTREMRAETWGAMEEIFWSGKARAIGVSNYTIAHLEEMKHYAKVRPAVNQVEFHPFLFQKELMEYCNKEEIILEAYSPLAHGRENNNSTITDIAVKHRCTYAQVLIRWSIQHGNVVIPKSVHRDRIVENIGVFNFALDEGDMARLDALNKNLRTCWDPNL